MDISKVFISYSWDSDEHKKWVASLADSLLEESIDPIFDQYDIEPGDRLTHFMEKSITEADKVLIICTPEYKKKADDRVGGAGYESNIISEELYSKHNERKFIPVLREGTFDNAMPVYLKGKYTINLTDNNMNYDNDFDDLIATLRGKNKKPKINLEKAKLNKYNTSK